MRILSFRCYGRTRDMFLPEVSPLMLRNVWDENGRGPRPFFAKHAGYWVIPRKDGLQIVRDLIEYGRNKECVRSLSPHISSNSLA